jgi:hypothetical protein
LAGPGAYVAAMEGRREAAANTAMVTGLVLTVLALFVPFASNEADCLDHCADAKSYYVWIPLHNFGAPLSALGVIAAVGLWRNAQWRRKVLPWVGMACGWGGLLVFHNYSHAIIEEIYLYGGPSLEWSDNAWLLGTGWLFLTVGAALASPPPTDDSQATAAAANAA